jgi:hypothetical protein
LREKERVRLHARKKNTIFFSLVQRRRNTTIMPLPQNGSNLRRRNKGAKTNIPPIGESGPPAKSHILNPFMELAVN